VRWGREEPGANPELLRMAMRIAKSGVRILEASMPGSLDARTTLQKDIFLDEYVILLP
jgi:hypothetical protein